MFKHRFVENMPPEIEEGILYISIEHDLVKHKCACGCGDEIVTSLSPEKWTMTYNGETVSLYPSIGNWTHQCQSHYFIKENKVKWMGKYTEQQIEKVIENDINDAKKYNNKPKNIWSKFKIFLGIEKD